MTRTKEWRARHLVGALVLVIVAGCMTPTPSSRPSGAPADPEPTGSVASAGPTSPSASAEPGDLAPFPSDIVSEIDAILDAPSLEQAIAATRIVLERSGVVVTDDPASAGRSPSGLYVGTGELATMAHEARSRAGLSHVTFAEFAETLAGLALLPPNDGLLARLPEPGATPGPDTDAQATLDLDGQPLRLAGVLTNWVVRSLDHHPSDDPMMTALTVPAIYLAELASRQDVPIDLREPFSPSRLELGSLDITLLIAGLRTSVAVAAPATLLASSATLARATVGGTSPGVGLAVETPACETVKGLIDARVPLLTDIYAFIGSETIKDLAEAVIKDVFNLAPIAKAFAPLFEALGVMAKVQALWLLYRHTEVTLRIDPESLHKSVGVDNLANAILVAGIPDAEWEKAKQERDSSPFAAQLKACARSMGIPTTTDLVDVGDATSTWRVAWDITEGGAHAKFEGCQFLPSCDRNAVAAGRYERSLAKRDDHSAQDSVILEILPEKESDHPGREVTAPVRVCAHVRTDKPPDIGTFLNAGSAGIGGSFGPGGIASLAASVSNILLGWWQFVFTIDACAKTTVSFHVPKPGNWQGTITVNTEFQESTTTTTKNSTYTSRRSTDVTDVYYVGGDDTGQTGGRIRLEARMFIRGGEVASEEQHSLLSNASGCRYTKDYVRSFGGSWNLEADAEVGINLQPDGKYEISFGPLALVNEILLPVVESTTLTDAGSPWECTGLGTTGREYELAPNGIYAGTYLIEDSVAPAFPGRVLSGSMTIRDPNDPRYFTTVEWNLTRDQPIVLPAQQGG